MTLLLIRMASLVGPRLLGGGLVATAFLMPGPLMRSAGPSGPAPASPFESNKADSGGDAPSVFGRAEGGRGVDFAALLAVQEAPPIPSATTSSASPSGTQTQTQTARPTMAALGNSGDGGRASGSHGPSNAPTAGGSLGSSPNGGGSNGGGGGGGGGGSGGSSSSGSGTTSASASSAAQIESASRSNPAGQGSSDSQQAAVNVAPRPGAAMASSNVSTMVSPASSGPSTPLFMPVQLLVDMPSASASLGRSAGTASR